MRRSVVWVVVAVGVPIAVGVLLIPVREQMTSANLALVMLLGAVAVAVASNSVTASVVSAGSAALAYDFFLVHPYYSITIAEPAEALTTLLVLIVVVVVGFVSRLARRQRSLIERREENLGVVYQLVDQVAAGAPAQAMIDMSRRELEVLLRCQAVRFEEGEAGAVGALTRPTIDRVGEIHLGADLVDLAQHGLPGPEVELAVESGGLRFGAFIITSTPDQPVDRWALVVAVMIADLVGAALARWPTEL